MSERLPYSLTQLTLYFLKLGSIGFWWPRRARRIHVSRSRGEAPLDQRRGLQGRTDVGAAHARSAGCATRHVSWVRALPNRRRNGGRHCVRVAILSHGGGHRLGLHALRWPPMDAGRVYGVGTAVIGIIAVSAFKLTTKNIGKDKLLWAIYLVTAGITVWTQSESVWLFLGAGVLVWLVPAPPKRWFGKNAAPALLAPSPHGPSTCAVATGLDWTLLAQLGAFFAKAGAFVFGSGLAIVPFLYGGVVHDYQWLNERQFVDAVAVAMITPGPVVITVGFIGYLIAGLPGAVVAASGTFLPCYLFTILPAPYFKKYGKRPAPVAFVDGVTAAAIGAITGAVIVLAERSIVDLMTALMALVTVGLIWKVNKLPEPALVAIAAIVGLVAFPGLRA